MRRSCASRNRSGDPCLAAPLRDGAHCRMHSPEHADEVAQARRLGGIRRRREVAVAGAYDIDSLRTTDDVLRVLEVAVLDTLAQENSTARSRTLGYLMWITLKAYEAGEIEERLASLEAVMLPRQRRAGGRR